MILHRAELFYPLEELTVRVNNVRQSLFVVLIGISRLVFKSFNVKCRRRPY